MTTCIHTSGVRLTMDFCGDLFITHPRVEDVRIERSFIRAVALPSQDFFDSIPYRNMARAYGMTRNQLRLAILEAVFVGMLDYAQWGYGNLSEYFCAADGSREFPDQDIHSVK